MEESQLSLHFSALNRNNPNITVNLNYLYLHNLIQHQAGVDKSHAYESARVSLDNCTIIVLYLPLVISFVTLAFDSFHVTLLINHYVLPQLRVIWNF